MTFGGFLEAIKNYICEQYASALNFLLLWIVFFVVGLAHTVDRKIIANLVWRNVTFLAAVTAFALLDVERQIAIVLVLAALKKISQNLLPQ